MAKELVGVLDGKGKRFGIVVSRFNDSITRQLLSGAIDCLVRHGVKEADIVTAWVPGSLEIPPVAKRLANSGRVDAVICLGTVIRGSTPHFEYVASEVSKGIAKVSLDSGLPVIFGVITSDTIEQAIERAGTKDGNKGHDAAVNAIEMVNLMDKIK